jgi:simple sugar transport system substrate-binding protein
MKRRTLLGAVAAIALTTGMSFAQDGKTFYWISHGGPADPVWTYFLQGAEQWAKDSGNTVNTSFHSGDVPSQQESGLDGRRGGRGAGGGHPHPELQHPG